MDSKNDINLSELKLLLENHFARTDKKLSEIQKDNAEFRTQLNKDFIDFKEAMIKEFSSFKDNVRIELQGIHSEIADVRSEFKTKIADVRAEIANVRSELKAEFADLRSDVKVQTSRIDSLVHWNYWILALFIAFFMMPSVIEGIRAVFSALSHGIASFFKRKNSD